MSEFYEPDQDSFLFADFIKENIKNKDARFLDMGCGSCILAKTAREIGIKEIVCADINKKAVELAKKLGFKVYHSNLFKEIPKNERFDIICFNAPYLPLDKDEPKKSRLATTGGKKGDELSIRFLKQAKEYLSKDGKIYLLISSLTPKKEIEKFNARVVARKKIFFEELILWEVGSR